MKSFLNTILIFFGALACTALFQSGCTTTPAVPTVRQVTVANAVEDALSVGLVPVLAKNRAYIPEAKAAAAILGAFTGSTLTPADVDAFLAKLNLAPEDARAVAGLVNSAWAVYQRRYAEQVGASVRPDVKLFLAAAARGILAAASAVPVANWSQPFEYPAGFVLVPNAAVLTAADLAALAYSPCVVTLDLPGSR